MIIRLLVFFCVGLTLIACEEEKVEIKNYSIIDKYSDTVSIGYTPKDMSIINSGFDDFNMGPKPPVNSSYLITFSTNRMSSGKHFNLVSCRLHFIANIWYHYSSETEIITGSNYDSVTIEYNYCVGPDTTFAQFLPDINTKYNELGPYFYSNEKLFPWKDYNFLFFLARDEKGNRDLFYNTYYYDKPFHLEAREDGFRNLSFLNTEYDEAYISISDELNALLFCSNRQGNFDIFQVVPENNAHIESFVSNPVSFQLGEVEALNSQKEDCCPFVHDNVIIFTSNRAGGYGGYDLYYSRYLDNEWCDPVNFGKKINSEYDEFRPVSFENDIMIFSSNRPSSKGGYDLYIVRIDGII